MDSSHQNRQLKTPLARAQGDQLALPPMVTPEKAPAEAATLKAFAAVAGGDVVALREAIAEGADLNAAPPALLEQYEGCCLVALAVVCFSRKAEVHEERSLSSFASKRQRAGVLRELLKHRLRLNRADGLRPPELRLNLLHLLSLGRFSAEERDVVRVLVRLAAAEGVGSGAPDARGLSALELAVLEDQVVVLEELLAAGARQSDGARAATFALQTGRQQCLKILRDKGLLPQAPAASEATPSAGEGVQVLLQPGSTPPASPSPGKTSQPSPERAERVAAHLSHLELNGRASSAAEAEPAGVPAHSIMSPPSQAALATPLQALQALLAHCLGVGALDAVAFGCFLLHCKREGAAGQQATLGILQEVDRVGGVAAVGEVVRQELGRLGAGAGGAAGPGCSGGGGKGAVSVVATCVGGAAV